MERRYEVGNLLKTHRKAKNLTVPEVSVLLREKYGLDVAEKTIYSWESDQYFPKTKVFFCLCDLYQIDHLYDEMGMGEAKGKTPSLPKFPITEEEKFMTEACRTNPLLAEMIDTLLGLNEDEEDGDGVETI